jgi:hypothetical protein
VSELKPSEDLVLELDAFVCSTAVSRGTPHAVFLGAGASISSGVPSADRCIWEWKRAIFLSNNPGLEKQFAELSLGSVQERIQTWLDKKGGFPSRGASEEYAFYIEKCYPLMDHRRLFFKEFVQNARPHLGYHLLCLLAEMDFIRSVWTTNFDALVARASADFNLVPIEVGIDSQERLPRATTKGELLCVSMHGDYRYDRLKNTAKEVKEQEGELRTTLVRQVFDMPFIVCGYSGRDESVMSAFSEAYSRPGTGTLYWCGFGDRPDEQVKALIVAARKSGRVAHYIPSVGFDDLFYRIAILVLPPGDETVQRLAGEFGISERQQRAPFQIMDGTFNGAVKSNAFPITCPAEALLFEPKQWPSEKRWRWVEELTESTGLVAVPFRKKILCLGTIDEIQTVFGENIFGPIDRVPFDEKEKRFDDSSSKALLVRSLVQSISKICGFPHDRRNLIWDLSNAEPYQFAGMTHRVHDAAFLSLKRIDNADYLLVMPSLQVLAADGTVADIAAVRAVRQFKLGYQHNKPFDEAVMSWANRIFRTSNGRFECPPDSGSTFHFQIKKTPIFAKVVRPQGRPLNIKPEHQKHYRNAGFQLQEPKLLFAPKNVGGPVTSIHPIRGILENRPFDYAMTQKGFASSVRLGVVCPVNSARLFHNFLSRAASVQRPSASESDYLLDFPGFHAAFAVPLEIPSPSDPEWQDYQAPTLGTDIRNGGLEMARNIIQSINAIRALSAPAVIIICIPTSVDSWTRFETDDELFDLHDFIKAYCVQQGIATQFIQESTSGDPQQCRVWWWISLALYVKAMRTPWLLQGLDENTAFVGFGVSVNRKAEKGKHVVLGCSHIYNSQGIGLQYRLTKVENPIFIGRKNVFLSRDDARRVGETVRLLFWEAQLKLPARVVFHKRTYFHREEREGLLEALGDVSAVDMVEINVSDDLRYVSSWAGAGGLQVGNYPVERGTVLKLEDFQALLWVHGSTSEINPHKTYYQGKRRIPAPLVLKRHSGRSPLKQIAEEILGLSKMHWNTFDLYTRLPATIESSNEIARIGALLERFGAKSYDYRLFI